MNRDQVPPYLLLVHTTLFALGASPGLLHAATPTQDEALTHTHTGPELPQPLQTDTWPEEWRGIWNLSTVSLDCVTGAVLDSTVVTDTLCAGEVIVLDDENPLVCSFSADGTMIEASCTTLQIAAGCTLRVEISQSLSRADNTITGSGTLTVTSEGDCPNPQNICTDFEITGSRTGLVSLDCTPISRRLVTTPELVDFPTVTVGDTATVKLILYPWNQSDPVVVRDILTPSGIRYELPPGGELPFTVSMDVALDLFLEPTEEVAITPALILEIEDPEFPSFEVSVRADVRGLDFSTRHLVPGSQAPLAQSITVLVSPEPAVRIEQGWVTYRPVLGEYRPWRSSRLEPNEDDFVALIPAEWVSESDVEYYVSVENSGVFAEFPPGAPDSTVFIDVASPRAIRTTPGPETNRVHLSGEQVLVSLEVDPGTIIETARLHYRSVGESTFDSTPFTIVDNFPDLGIQIAVASIPDSAFGPAGAQYWAEVITTSGTRLTDPELAPETRPWLVVSTVPDIREPREFAPEQYRLVTVPLLFESATTMVDILADQEAFGAYDPSQWRAFTWAEATRGYLEIAENSEQTQLLPGRGYWLVSRSRNRISTSPVRGKSTGYLWRIDLHPGWNLVGNPFIFEILWENYLATIPPGWRALIDPPRRWNSDAQEYDPEPVTTLKPFEAVFVFNGNAETVEIVLPAIKAGPSAVFSRPGSGPEPPAGWSIEIRASSGESVDYPKVAGVISTALTERDNHDRYLPPPSPGPHLSVYFPHENWTKAPGQYEHDIRAPVELGEGHVWRFDTTRLLRDEEPASSVHLQFELVDVPPDLEVRLVDRRLSRSIDLRLQKTYSFVLGDAGIRSEDDARFELLVGSSEFIQRGRTELPQRTELLPNYPNPFRAGSVIRYSLAVPGQVNLRVFDLRGRLVNTVDSGRREAGVHEVAWEGHTARGQSSPPGVYFLRMEAAGFKETRKLILVR